jgi:hypothetical protein
MPPLTADGHSTELPLGLLGAADCRGVERLSQGWARFLPDLRGLRNYGPHRCPPATTRRDRNKVIFRSRLKLFDKLVGAEGLEPTTR